MSWTLMRFSVPPRLRSNTLKFVALVVLLTVLILSRSEHKAPMGRQSNTAAYKNKLTEVEPNLKRQEYRRQFNLLDHDHPKELTHDPLECNQGTDPLKFKPDIHLMLSYLLR